MNARHLETTAPIEPKDNRLRIEAVVTALEIAARDLSHIQNDALSDEARIMLGLAQRGISQSISRLNLALNHGTDVPIDANFVRHDRALPAAILPKEGNPAP